MDQRTSRAAKAQFGAPGLDDILNGGLVRNRLYLMEGVPGSGKTTLGLQFLLEGANAGEKGLYITLSETEQELRETAASHNWSIPSKIDIFELVPPESLLDEKHSKVCCIHPTLSSVRRHTGFSRPWTGRGRRASCSTACPRYVCLRKTLFVIVAKSSP
jgi:KaiC/GvpD/RAD55 family RecA-like ATPase